MSHVCSWQHQSTSEKIMDIEETPHGVYFLCDKSKPLGKKMPLPQLLTVCCPNWTSRTQKTRWDNPSETLFHRKVCQIF